MSGNSPRMEEAEDGPRRYIPTATYRERETMEWKGGREEGREREKNNGRWSGRDGGRKTMEWEGGKEDGVREREGERGRETMDVGVEERHMNEN